MNSLKVFNDWETNRKDIDANVKSSKKCLSNLQKLLAVKTETQWVGSPNVSKAITELKMNIDNLRDFFPSWEKVDKPLLVNYSEEQIDDILKLMSKNLGLLSSHLPKFQGDDFEPDKIEEEKAKCLINESETDVQFMIGVYAKIQSLISIIA